VLIGDSDVDLRGRSQIDRIVRMTA